MPEPRTRDELVELLAARAQMAGHEPEDAQALAAVGIRGLIERGWLREWGFTRAGEVLYERAEPFVIVIRVKT